MKNPAKQKIRPAQKQKRPGKESKLKPESQTTPENYSNGKLFGKVVLITGGDSGIGKAIALLLAKEGAKLVIAYLSETADAEKTQSELEELKAQCLLIKADLAKESQCKTVISKTIKKYKSLDIVINNTGMHWESNELANISTKQLLTTFHINFFAHFWICKYALPYLKKGSSIINTASVVAYRGSDHLMDYSAAKGAIIAFTRSLSSNLVKKGIRVNAVAPGPVWTPLIASTFESEDVATFGSDSPMQRAGMPNEIAPAYLFLASHDSSFITGQVIHVNGGEIING